MILSLPPELVLSILAQTASIPAIVAFRKTSRATNALVSAASSSLFRALSFSLGWCDEASSAATGLETRRASPSRVFDAEELGRAVRAQHAMSSTYDGVTTWEQFARKRFEVERGWRTGRCVQSWIKLDPVPFQGIWRFKLDPEACGGKGCIVTSGMLGGYQAWSVEDGALIWSTTEPDMQYPHVELSEGYLVYNNPGSNKLIIWRRDDILTPASPLDPDRYRSLLEDAHPTSDGGAVAYVPFCVLSPPTPCLATKARFPLLAAVGHGTQEVYLFNLAEGRLQSTIDISALFDNDALRDPFVTYVELDQQHVYVSGRLSTSIWTHQGQSVGTLPPSPPLALARGPVGTRGRFYRDPSTNRFVQWSAAHHGTGGKDFVAVTLSGALLWTPKQREVLRDGSRDAIQAGSVVLQMPRPIVQLSVENGRAVFITQSPSNRCGLWLINLRPFDSLDDFRRDPPQPICLCYPLPALFTPSRVEATSTCIFVGGQSCFGPDGLLDRTFAELPKREEGGLPSSYSWYTLDGEVLAKGGRGREASRELVKWERLVRLAEAALSPEERWVDAFVMFRFGEEEGGRQVV